MILISKRTIRILLGGALLAAVPCFSWAEDVAKSHSSTEPKAAGSSDRIAQLIKQLGDKDYHVRQRAQSELAKSGFVAFDALNTATTDEDLEIASRAKYLLRLMRVEWTGENDSAEVKRCLRDYEFEDAEARGAKIKLLANLPNGQGAGALCRLVRFEKSPALSKLAAVALLNSHRNAAPPSAAMVETIRGTLGDANRPGALWLLAWTKLPAEPDAVMTQWKKFVNDEQTLLRRSPRETNAAIVVGLTRFQITRLKKLGKTEEAGEAIRRLIEVERGEGESLNELTQWLAEQKAWSAIEDLSKRFSARFAQNPVLLYTLAQAHSELGQKDKAAEVAQRAFQINPGRRHGELFQHLVTAQHLRSRGLFDWARREFQHVITQGALAESDEVYVLAQAFLAEMHHDQFHDDDAAAVLEKLVAEIKSGKVTESELSDRKPSSIRSRMHYFLACHWKERGDAAKHREAIDAALQADPSDVDVLIACYRLPDQSPEYHAKILDLIKKSAEECREEIAASPEEPSPYNQFAWLIGNTEGDFDEALRCSLKSLELKPDEGGFYDTLARVYYAKGDVENAVKQQTKAAELEPHSGLIQRQLEYFRKELKGKDQT